MRICDVYSLKSHLNPVVVTIVLWTIGTYEHHRCSSTQLCGTEIVCCPGGSSHANVFFDIRNTSMCGMWAWALNSVLICDRMWSMRPEKSTMLITNSMFRSAYMLFISNSDLVKSVSFWSGVLINWHPNLATVSSVSGVTESRSPVR